MPAAATPAAKKEAPKADANMSVDSLVSKMRSELAKDEKKFEAAAVQVAANDVALFKYHQECMDVVLDLKRLEMGQSEDLERRLDEAEARQGNLERELSEVEKHVESILGEASTAGSQVSAGLQQQDYDRAAMVSMSKDVQDSMEGLQKQLKQLVEQMNADYEGQVGAERTQKQVMGHLNKHHQLIQYLTCAAREMELDVAELEAQQARF